MPVKDVVIYFVATDSTIAKSKNLREQRRHSRFADENKLTVRSCATRTAR